MGRLGEGSCCQWRDKCLQEDRAVTVGCGWWGVPWMEERQQVVGYKEPGGRNPKCDHNQDGVFSGFSLEA